MLKTLVFRRLAHTKAIKKDILIIGGGAAGLSLVTSLQHSLKTKGLDLALVDSQPMASRLGNWSKDTQNKEFENRVISVTPGTIKFFEEIGSWKNVVHDRTLAYDEMRIWDGETGSAIEFDAFDSESGSVATMIENSNVMQSLFVTGNTKDVVTQASVETITLSKDGYPMVHLSNGTQIEAKLLVGADGQNSPVRKFAGIGTQGWDYNKHGVVATLKLEYDDYKQTAYQRFLRSGPLAFLPLPNGYATLVWSTYPERAQWLKELEPAAFAAMVNAGVRLDMADVDYLHSLPSKNTEEIISECQWRLDGLDESVDDHLPVMVESVAKGSVASFPLKLRQADTYITDRVALIGDAAHATHPLTGQGLNMGRRDVNALVESISLALDRGLDIGSLNALEPYLRKAYLQNQVLLGFNDSLYKLYTNDFWPVVQLRSFGVDVLNKLDWVKSKLVAQAD